MGIFFLSAKNCSLHIQSPLPQPVTPEQADCLFKVYPMSLNDLNAIFGAGTLGFVSSSKPILLESAEFEWLRAQRELFTWCGPLLKCLEFLQRS